MVAAARIAIVDGNRLRGDKLPQTLLVLQRYRNGRGRVAAKAFQIVGASCRIHIGELRLEGMVIGSAGARVAAQKIDLQGFVRFLQIAAVSSDEIIVEVGRSAGQSRNHEVLLHRGSLQCGHILRPYTDALSPYRTNQAGESERHGPHTPRHGANPPSRVARRHVKHPGLFWCGRPIWRSLDRVDHLIVKMNRG